MLRGRYRLTRIHADWRFPPVTDACLLDLCARLAMMGRSSPRKLGLWVETLPQHFYTRSGVGTWGARDKSLEPQCPKHCARTADGPDWRHSTVRSAAKAFGVGDDRVVPMAGMLQPLHMLHKRTKFNCQLDCTHYCYHPLLWDGMPGSSPAAHFFCPVPLWPHPVPPRSSPQPSPSRSDPILSRPALAPILSRLFPPCRKRAPAVTGVAIMAGHSSVAVTSPFCFFNSDAASAPFTPLSASAAPEPCCTRTPTKLHRVMEVMPSVERWQQWRRPGVCLCECSKSRAYPTHSRLLLCQV